MRRIILLMISLSVVLVLSACGSTAERDTQQGNEITPDYVSFKGENRNTEEEVPVVPGREQNIFQNPSPDGGDGQRPNRQNQRGNNVAETPRNTNPADMPNERQLEQGRANQSDSTGEDSQISNFAKQVAELTNAARLEGGLKALALDNDLTEAAQLKSDDMAQNGYFSHQSPTYGSPFDLMNQVGINYSSAAENIAAGQRTPEQVVNSWLNSEGHRANILDPDMTHIGVGYNSNGHYWTQMFIKSNAP